MNFGFILVVAALLHASFSSVQAITCYNCNSDRDFDCLSADPDVLEQFRADCDVSESHYDRCAMAYGTGTVTRSCYHFDPAQDYQCIRTDPGVVNRMIVCKCNGNLCNGGDIASPSFSL